MNLKDTVTREWIRKTFGYSLPEIWIKDNARNLLQQTRQFFPPIQLQHILKVRRISPIIKYDSNITNRAKLFTNDFGFEIHIKEFLKYPINKEQWRFTIAHEVGHTFFYDLKKTPPSRPPSMPFADSVEENLCNTFAYELLMPEENIVEEIKKYKKDKFISSQLLLFRNLFRMQRLFGVSIYDLCLRIVRSLGLWNSLFFFCRWQPKCPFNSAQSSSLYKNGEEDVYWRVMWNIIPKKFERDIFIPRPTKDRPGRPSVHLKILEELWNKKMEDEILEVNVPLSELRLGNLFYVLRKNYGYNTHYPLLIKRMILKKDKTLDIFSTDSYTDSYSGNRQNVGFLVGIPLEKIEGLKINK